MSDKQIVLIVEDEPLQAKLLAEYVEEAGEYQAVIAHNGLEAFEQLRKHRRMLGFAQNRIACMLLDMRMPEMDGMQFLVQFREEETKNAYHRHIPVIVTTAYDDESYWNSTTNPEKGMVAGYLVKPIDPIRLEHMLTQILECGDTEFMIDQTREAGYAKFEGARKAQKEKEMHEAHLKADKEFMDNIARTEEFLRNLK